MPATTSAQLTALDANYKKAWDEEPKAFEACASCASPDYCKVNGCQQKQAADLKKLEG